MKKQTSKYLLVGISASILVALLFLTINGDLLAGYLSVRPLSTLQNNIRPVSNIQIKTPTLAPGVNICNQEIKLNSTNFDKELSINYCTHFLTEGNVKIYFVYEPAAPSLTTYYVINKSGTDYVVSMRQAAVGGFIDPSFQVPVNDFHCPVTTFNITNFDDQTISLTFHKDSKTDSECSTGYPSSEHTFYSASTTHTINYYDTSIFSSSSVASEYVKINSQLRENIYNFLTTFFGDALSPVKYVNVNIPYETSPAEAYLTEPPLRLIEITGETYNDTTFANVPGSEAHEFTHYFVHGTPVFRIQWLEEGLADYIQGKYLKSNGIACKENGWTNPNDPVIGLIPYSDFNQQPVDGLPFTDPLNKGSYYHSGMCFWQYIEDNYGADKVKTITKAWIETRKEIPPATLPQKQKHLVRDIINPILNTDLSGLLKKRYNYQEP